MDIEKKENLKEVIEWIICIVFAVVLALIVKHYVFTPTLVNQFSMEPTLHSGDRLILNRLCITMNDEIKRGDIITFEAPSLTRPEEAIYDEENPVATYFDRKDKSKLSNFVYYTLEFNKTSYIKRVIAVAGDHIKIEDGKVYLNGELLKEEYLSSDVYTEKNGMFCDLTVPEGYVYAMGDNRPDSMDCRAFGCIPLEKVESRVAFRFWPLNKFGKV